MTDEEIRFQKRIRDLAQHSYMENRYRTTRFLNENEQSLILQLERELPIAVSLYGGNTDCERKIAIFGNEETFGYKETLPIALLHMIPVAKKFADSLSHRDVLGALMHLGMEREMIGDIFLKENEVYVFCMDTMAEYISAELCKIRHTIVKTEILDLEQGQDLVLLEGKEKEILVPSLRLDAIVAAVYHLSRQQSQLLFRERKVFVKGKLMENNSGLLKENSMVSVRQKGRFLFEKVENQTQKGKYRILVQIFQEV